MRRNPNPDNITLVSLPRVDRATQSSEWFSALAETGVTIAVYPVERDALPGWIAARLARQKQRASRETLAFLADACEGNLLAARQEIEKLALLLPEGELDTPPSKRAVADVARFDVFELSEAWLAGDAARAVRILRALQAEGDAPTLPIWQLSEDVHAIARSPRWSAAARRLPLPCATRACGASARRALERAVVARGAVGDRIDARRARAARCAREGHRHRQRVGRARDAGADPRGQRADARTLDAIQSSLRIVQPLSSARMPGSVGMKRSPWPMDVGELVGLVHRLRDERRRRRALRELRVEAHVLARDAQRALEVAVVTFEHPGITIWNILLLAPPADTTS